MKNTILLAALMSCWGCSEAPAPEPPPEHVLTPQQEALQQARDTVEEAEAAARRRFEQIEKSTRRNSDP